MATLSGNKIKDTYQSLIKLTDNGNLTTGAKQVTDGFGNNSPLYISTTQIGIGVTPEATYDLHVYQNAKVGGNLTITGDLTVNGTTTTVDTDTLRVEDPLIEVARNNTSSDAVDIGIYGKYAPSGTTLYAGLFRDTGDDKFKLFKSLQEQPTTTVNTSGTGYTVATLVANVEGTLTGIIASTTTATTQSTGDNSTKVATTAYVDASIGNSTLAEVLVNGDTTGGGNIVFGDSDSFLADDTLMFGASNDLVIYHDGSNSFIREKGTGNLYIDSDVSINLRSYTGAENMLVATKDGAVDLYYDASKKLETTSTGVTVTGAVSATTFSGQLDGTISSATTAVTQSDGDNSTKVATTAYVDTAIQGHDTLAEILTVGNTTGGTDIAVSSGDDITFADSSKAIFGAGSDLKIFSDGSGGYIRGITAIQSQDGTDDFLSTAANAGVSLFYNNSKKFETTSTGVSVTGEARVYSGSSLGYFGVDTGNSYVYLGTNTSGYSLALQTAGTNALTIDNTQKVGLGTNSPQSNLHISTSATNASIRLQNDNGSGSTANFVLQTDSSGLGNNGFGIYDVANSAYRLTIDGTGIVNVPETLKIGGATSGTKTLIFESTTNAQDYNIDFYSNSSAVQGRINYAEGAGSINLFPNSSATAALSLAYGGDATFVGNIQANGTFIELDSASDAQVIIDRADGTDVARVTWRNAGSTHFTAGIETSSNDLWSLLHTCGSGLFFDGTAMAFGFGVDNPSTAITLPQGNSTGAKISWYDSTPTFAASIYARSSTDKLTFATKNSSNAETIALEIDTSQNSTFYGNLIVNNSSNAPYIDFVESGAITDSKARITMDQVDTNNGELIFSTEGSGTLTTAVTIDSNQNTTFAGPVWIPTYIYHVGDTNSYFGFSGDDTFVIYTNGLERFQVTSEGQVYNRESPNRANTAFGYDSGNAAVTTGTGNTTYGYNTGHDITSGCCNTLIGRDVGANITTGAQNVGVGQGSLQNVTTALELVSIGYNSMITATTSSQCTAVGTNTLKFNTGNYNDAFGFRAGESNTTGAENSFIGRYSGFSNTTGSANTALGNAALESNSTGGNNTALGYLALYDSTTASNNTAVGSEALRNNTTAVGMTAIGHRAGYNHTADYDTYVGFQAGYGAGSGGANAGLGYRALHDITGGDSNTAAGYEAGRSVTTGAANTLLGRDAGRSLSTTSRNTIVGAYAGDATSYTGTSNTILGTSAGGSITSGSYNVLMGDGAGRGITNTNENVLIGHETGVSLNGHYNSCVGFKNLNASASGQFNTSMGFAALNRYTGDENTAIGAYAAHYTTTATRTTAIGMQSGFNITTGAENTTVGYKAGTNINVGQYNVSIGSLCMLATQAGDFNTGVGRTALYQLTNGDHNIGIGYDAFQAITTQNYNTGVGNSVGTFQLGNYNTCMGYFSNYGVSTASTGDYITSMGYYAGAYNKASNNTFLGALAGRYNSDGEKNTIVGSQAADNGTITGDNNSALGFGALHNVTSGANNVALGANAAFTQTTGEGQISIGVNALYTCSTGSGNIAIGKNSGYGLTTGGSNTFIGYAAAGGGTVGGSANIIIGDAAGYNLSGGSNNICIGQNAGRTGSTSPASLGGITTNSNEIQFGNNNHQYAYIKIAWTVTSDKRDKAKIKDLDKGLDFIDKLNPVSYEFRKERNLEETDNKKRYGFIAQDVLELEGDNPVIVNDKDEENLKLTNEYIIPVLVNAIKELKKEIEILKSK